MIAMRHLALRSLQRFVALQARLRSDEHGGILLIFAATLPVILGFAIAIIDYGRASTARITLQNGVDAATIYAARSNATNNTELQAAGSKMLRANLVGLDNATLISSDFRMDANQRVFGTAEMSVPVSIAGFLGLNAMTVSSTSEVARSSNSVEVSLALDVTGSMAGQKLADLKSAAKELIGIVVKDVQTPFYSKVAIVPYSMAVNVGTYANQVRGPYSNGSSRTPGSQQYEFRNAADNNYKTFTISNCVTERTGVNAYTDVAPSVTYLGRNYPSPTNPCLTNTIVPLSSSKTLLGATVDSLVAGGSTGGHIGVAWGWYLVSPNFGSLWPAASRPAAYGTRDLLKVVVLMTDGEYNSSYYNGVISRNSTSGSGATADHINNDSLNGSAFYQAEQLCTRMKAAGVIVYTVGLDVSSDQRAKDIVNNCATDAAHVYLPSGGTALKDAFRAIAQEINSLRIAH